MEFYSRQTNGKKFIDPGMNKRSSQLIMGIPHHWANLSPTSLCVGHDFNDFFFRESSSTTSKSSFNAPVCLNLKMIEFVINCF